MSQTITISGEGGKLDLEVVGYERPNSSGSEDANWLTCNLFVSCGAFHGTTDLAIMVEDLVGFGRELSAILDSSDGKAILGPYEEDLQCTVVAVGSGRMEVCGHVRASYGAEVDFGFKIKSDRSYMVLTCREIDEVLTSFPVR